MPETNRKREQSGRVTNRVSFAFVVLVAVLVFVVCSHIMMPYVPDEAYIGFRYAEHLADGAGLRFNKGESPIEGYGNFLWVLMCAGVHKSGRDLPDAMPWAGVVFGVLNVFVLGVIFRRRGHDGLQMILPLLVFASAGPFVAYAASGLEAPLFSLLLLLTVMMLDSVLAGGGMVSYLLVAGLGVLLALCRHEGIVVFPLVVLWLVLCIGRSGRASNVRLRKKALWSAIGIFSMSIVLYHVWRVSYFGAWMPTTFGDRFGGGDLFWTWLKNLRAYFVMQGNDFLPSGYRYVALLLLGAVGLSVSRADTVRKRSDQLVFCLVCVLVLLYVNFTDPMPGMRYHSVLIGLILIPAIHVQLRAAETIEHASRRSAILRVIGAFVAVLVLGCSWLAEVRMGTSRVEDGNRECSTALGKWFREVLPPETRLAAGVVGALSYYTGFETLDIDVTPVVSRHPEGKGLTDTWFVDWQPDVAVFDFDALFDAEPRIEYRRLFGSALFKEKYRLFAVVRHDWYKDKSYWIYISRSVPKFSEAALATMPAGIGSVVRAYP